jgi:hypothetical protein
MSKRRLGYVAQSNELPIADRLSSRIEWFPFVGEKADL